MWFGILTLLIALCISGIAAFYSILGLTTIYPASFAWIPIILMGSVIELGKISAAVWLHTYWKKANLLFKYGLCAFVLSVMFVTSAGVFGFLSKAHTESTAASVAQTAKIEQIDESIIRKKLQINRWTVSVTDLNKGSGTDRIDLLIQREQERIALTKGTLVELTSEATVIHSQADKAIAAQRQRITDAQERVMQATGAARTRASRNELSVASRAQKEIIKATDLREKLLASLQIKINAERDRIQPILDEIGKRISDYASKAGSTDVNVDGKIMKLEKMIDVASDELGILRDEKFIIEGKSRDLEAELGPIRAIASVIYGDNPDANLLERAVQGFTILIVVIFDPFAIMLILASTMIFKWYRENDPDVTNKIIVEKIVEKIVEVPVEVEVEIEVEIPVEVEKIVEKIVEVDRPVKDIAKVARLEEQLTAAKADIAKRDLAIIKLNDQYDLIEKETSTALRDGTLKVIADDAATQANAGFGTEFPSFASDGDMYIRVDFKPNKVFQLRNNTWIEIQVEELTEAEQEQVRETLINRDDRS